MNKTRGILLSGWTLFVGACSLNFNEAIPCDDDSQCPGDLSCDRSLGRCASGDASLPDVEEDASDTVERPDITADIVDVSDVQDTADGSGDAADTSTPDTDAVSDTEPGDTTDTETDSSTDVDAGDTEADTCVPLAEICDGLDNDCDGTADNGIDCTGPCGPGTTVLTGTSGSFCIDLYEASRRDATEVSAGADNSIAVSRPGVLPWGFVPYATAEAACVAAGKRLCTPDEWQFACAGPDAWAYPYNRSIYAGTTCNGLNVAPRDAAVVTGQFSLCTNPATGTFDMSGNLSEWASDQGAHGGDFSDGQSFLRCNGVNRDISIEVAEPGVGFRCCADAPL